MILLQNHPISHSQWGFMPRRSTTSALYSMVHEWHNELNEGNEICSVSFDIRKAFDTACSWTSSQHSSSVHAYIYSWIYSYLTKRSKVVVVGGERSSTVDVVLGVPQGFVLGPLFFIYNVCRWRYTSQVCSLSCISLFADNIALYRSIHSLADCTVLQSDLPQSRCG